MSSLFSAAVLLGSPAYGQGRGAGAGSAGPTTGGTGAGTAIPSGTTTGPTTTGPTTTRPTIPSTTQPPQTTPQPQQPIFITGRVMLEDGTVPTDSVVIERVCNGNPHAEGYADSKGYFSIRLGDPNNGVIADASEDMSGFNRGMPGGDPAMTANNSQFGGNSRFGSENRFFDCEVRARLAGYRSQSILLANRRPMDPPDVGVILLHRLAPTEGTTVSAAALAAPKDAKKAYEKGMEALKKHKLDDAVKDFQKAVASYPKHAAAWVELGRIRAAHDDDTEARAYFQKAIDADPKFAGPYMDMAGLAIKAKNWPELKQLTEKVIQLDSFDYPQAHFFNALSSYYLKDMDGAEKGARETVKLDTRNQFPTAHHLLGVILAQKQEFPAAAEQLKAYLAAAPEASDAATVRNQLAQVEQALAAAKK